MSAVQGRVQVSTSGRWRPAHIGDEGAMWVSPSAGERWRAATPGERLSWQVRRCQHTVGRVWDDAEHVTHDVAWPVSDVQWQVSTLVRVWRERGAATPISGDPTWGSPEPVAVTL